MTYQPGVPTGTVAFNQDYLNLQGNFGQLNTQFQVDHVPLTSTSGTPPNGYHTQVHLVPEATPGATTGYGQLYSNTNNDGINNDQTLYWLTGGNRNIPLTMNFVPVTSNNTNQNGYTFLPGGIILQWGLASVPINSTTPLLFATNNIAFPNNCFNVSVTGIRANNGGDGVFLSTGSVSKAGFTFRNGSGSISQAYWIAIGN